MIMTSLSLSFLVGASACGGADASDAGSPNPISVLSTTNPIEPAVSSLADADGSSYELQPCSASSEDPPPFAMRTIPRDATTDQRQARSEAIADQLTEVVGWRFVEEQHTIQIGSVERFAAELTSGDGIGLN